MSSGSKDVVNFSWSELKFAEEKCESNHLYRVYVGESWLILAE